MKKEEVKTPLIILTGPTAVGKTALSVKLAQKTGGEIISADSMQVYRHMDIGSAKIRPDEMQGVPHHLIDVLSRRRNSTSPFFQNMAKKAIGRSEAEGIFPSWREGQAFISRRCCMTSILRKTRKKPPYGRRWSVRQRRREPNICIRC